MLDELKEYLRIDWSDEDVLLTQILARGESKLNGLTGVTLDFSPGTEERSLLLDYGRYDYNNATEYFERNFSQEILRLQLKVGVSEYELAQN